MNISCEHCNAKFNIPSEKIPPGKTVLLKCPKCEHRMAVMGPSESSPSQPADLLVESASGKPIYDPEDRPFGYMDEGVQTALICETDEFMKEMLVKTLTGMGYQMTEASDARTALKNMRYHDYDLVVVNEMFGTNDPNINGILIYMERLVMLVRRNIFVTLLSNRFRTMDSMMAFNKSVDLIINLENINEFEKILARGIKQKQAFYRVYKDTMKKAGRV